jgi:hypothetical protein
MQQQQQQYGGHGHGGHGGGGHFGAGGPPGRHHQNMRPGDWICPDPSCANLNFASRNVCRMCPIRKIHPCTRVLCRRCRCCTVWHCGLVLRAGKYPLCGGGGDGCGGGSTGGLVTNRASQVLAGLACFSWAIGWWPVGWAGGSLLTCGLSCSHCSATGGVGGATDGRRRWRRRWWGVSSGHAARCVHS